MILAEHVKGILNKWYLSHVLVYSFKRACGEQSFTCYKLWATDKSPFMSLQSTALILKKKPKKQMQKQSHPEPTAFFPELDHIEKFPQQICSRFLYNLVAQKNLKGSGKTLQPFCCSSLVDVSLILKNKINLYAWSLVFLILISYDFKQCRTLSRIVLKIERTKITELRIWSGVLSNIWLDVSNSYSVLRRGKWAIKKRKKSIFIGDLHKYVTSADL